MTGDQYQAVPPKAAMDCHFLLALASRKEGEGDIDAAIEAAEAAILAEPTNWQVWIELAHFRERAGRTEAAVEAASHAVELQPDNAGLHRFLCGLHIALNDLSKAETYARAAIEAEPKSPHHHDNLGHVLAKRGELKEATVAFRRASDIDSSNPVFALNLANGLLHDGELAEAEAVLNILSAALPSSPRVWCRLAQVQERRGALSRSLESYSAAAGAQPDDLELISDISFGLRQLGAADQAISMIRRAIKLAPDKSLFHEDLAELLMEVGQLDDAAISCKEALSLSAGSVRARFLHVTIESLQAEKIKAGSAVSGATDRSGVIVGRDGWLFHDTDGAIGQICTPFSVSEGQLSHLASLWEARHAWCAVRSIAYRILIVPERHALYPDKLPDGIVPDPDRTALRLLDIVDTVTRPAVLYPLETLRNGRKIREICYRTDLHWTRYGAYLAYRELMKTIPVCTENIIREQDLRIQNIRIVGNMTIILNRREREEVESVEPPESGMDEIFSTKTFKAGQVDVFESSNRRLPRLVLFRTSNSSHLLPFLYHSFSRIVAVATTDMYYDIIRSEAPDVVISELPERYVAIPEGAPDSGRFRFPSDLGTPSFADFTGVPLPLPRREPAT